MKIDVELTNDKCELMLLACGYITEEVQVLIGKNDGPYNTGTDSGKMMKVNLKIAYKESNRPPELDECSPTFDKLKDYAYEHVVSKLFNERLYQILFGTVHIQ